MRVRVRLFASLREAVGRDEISLELPEGARAEDVWLRIAGDHPSVAARRASLSVAVNRRYASFDQPLASGDEVVFIPPVSGG
jgi:molybdopterin synthase sulfur carrier subunit